jgi:hypothetical protein
MEFKSILRSAEITKKIVKWEASLSIQKKLLKLIEEAPELDMKFEKTENPNYSFESDYISGKGMVTTKLSDANDFIKANYEDWREVVLKSSGEENPALSYSALVASLNFIFNSPANSLEYETKEGKVKGYTLSFIDYLCNSKYEGVCIECETGTMYMLQGKDKTLSIETYEDFLDVVLDVFDGEDFDAPHDVKLFFPHLKLKLAPPNNILGGIEGHTKSGINNINFTQSKIHSTIDLDKNGMTVKTAAIVEMFTRGLSRDEFKVDDNLFIFLTDYEGDLVNALYVDKSEFIISE